MYYILASKQGKRSSIRKNETRLNRQHTLVGWTGRPARSTFNPQVPFLRSAMG